MGLTTFDTLKFVRRLEQAGVPSGQAEVQAEVLTEAFNVNLDSLVTKEHLAARLAEERSWIKTRFAEQDTTIEKRFAAHQTAIDARFAQVESTLKVHTVLLSIVMAAVVAPLIERWLMP